MVLYRHNNVDNAYHTNRLYSNFVRPSVTSPYKKNKRGSLQPLPFCSKLHINSSLIIYFVGKLSEYCTSFALIHYINIQNLRIVKLLTHLVLMTWWIYCPSDLSIIDRSGQPPDIAILPEFHTFIPCVFFYQNHIILFQTYNVYFSYKHFLNFQKFKIYLYTFVHKNLYFSSSFTRFQSFRKTMSYCKYQREKIKTNRSNKFISYLSTLPLCRTVKNSIITAISHESFKPSTQPPTSWSVTSFETNKIHWNVFLYSQYSSISTLSQIFPFHPNTMKDHHNTD